MKKDSFGKIIRDLRIENNLTQAQFAELFYVSPQAVSKWEMNKNLPDIETLYKISKKFDLNFSDLIGYCVNSDNLNAPMMDITKTLNSYSHRKTKIMLFFCIVSILICLLLFFLIIIHNDNYEMKKISTNIDNFSLYGTMIYNNNRTIIYISDITYEGDKNDKFVNIKCLLYEDDGETKKVISSFNYDDDAITLNEFLTKVNFSVNHVTDACLTKDNSLHLEIEAESDTHQSVFYKIPLILDNCEE